MAKIGGLGRGLGALLGDSAVAEINGEVRENNGLCEISINLIDPNIDQPRKNFDEQALAELADSIMSSGIIQPLVVCPIGERYMIVAGERRWRAARIAGLSTVPVVMREYDKSQLMEIALIENLQRADLNPIEEARGYKQLMDQHGYTQEEIARRIGKSRPSIANAVRLLNLCDEVTQMVLDGLLSAGHAKLLASVQDQTLQTELARAMWDESMSVREAEELMRKGPKKPYEARERKVDPELFTAQETLERKLETKVKILGSPKKGRIVIDYYTPEQLQGLYEYLTQ